MKAKRVKVIRQSDIYKKMDKAFIKGLTGNNYKLKVAVIILVLLTALLASGYVETYFWELCEAGITCNY